MVMFILAFLKLALFCIKRLICRALSTDVEGLNPSAVLPSTALGTDRAGLRIANLGFGSDGQFLRSYDTRFHRHKLTIDGLL